MAVPVRTGDEVEVLIDSLAYGGNGVGRLEGFVVFVRGGLPGDLVQARVTRVKKGFAEATRTALLEPGPGRVEPPCRHFGVCGGCRFQDLGYERQLEAKHEQVRDALVRLGGFADPPLQPIVPARSIYGYRNKLEYSFAAGDDGPVLGFHRAGRWDEVVDVEECRLTTDTGNAIREAVKAWARDEGLEPFDRKSGAGYLRHLVVREGRNTGQALVLLVTAPGERFDADFLIETLTRIPEVSSLHWAVNDRPAEVTNLPTKLLWGDEWIEEELLGLRFRVRPNAFLQTNTEMAETLYRLARDAAALTGSETVYDLYCGTGTIGLALAGGAGSVWGVEISEESVACAIENADVNGIANARFFAGNVGQSLDELAAKAGPPDAVVVDPPRAGLAGKALRRTGALGARRIVYVSCNPTTLASDLAVLRDEHGYELVECTPVDMFPHTPHIESVSLLIRAELSAEEHDGGAPGGEGTGSRRRKVREVNGRRLIALLVAAAALVAAGCGGGSDNNEASGSAETTVATDTAVSTDQMTTEESTDTGMDTEASIGALTGKCAELAQLGAKLSQSMAGQSGDLEDASKFFDELAGQVPDEIKADWEVLAKNFKKIAEALEGVNLQAGQTPSPDQAAKLQQALTSIDNAEVQKATQHIEAWAAKNC